MAGLDYYAITDKIREILADDPLMQGIAVETEGEANFISGETPWVGVFFERRDPHPDQNLDAGQSTRYVLRFTIWCWAMSLEEIRLAIKERNRIIDLVERVLMANRDIGGLVDYSFLAGGETPSGRFAEDNGAAVYLSGGEVVLLADVSTQTV